MGPFTVEVSFLIPYKSEPRSGYIRVLEFDSKNAIIFVIFFVKHILGGYNRPYVYQKPFQILEFSVLFYNAGVAFNVVISQYAYLKKNKPENKKNIQANSQNDSK